MHKKILLSNAIRWNPSKMFENVIPLDFGIILFHKEHKIYVILIIES